MNYCHSEVAIADLPARQAPTYRTKSWGGNRHFESSETTRLNQSHWLHADDQSVNVWLLAELATIRARANFEARQNGTVLGVINTHADDIVGINGPTLQVLSDDETYNSALEHLWMEWFAAPTIRSNLSGAQWLRLCVRSLWKNGEYLAQIVTDPDAEGPISLRIKPIHPRRLATPIDLSSDPSVFMGVRLDGLGRPRQYFIQSTTAAGTPGLNVTSYYPVPPDLILHEFLVEEEDQQRGIPWCNTALQPAADLRDYDDQVQDAARLIADQAALLYTDNPNVEVWDSAESMTVQRRQINMAPPGWKPWQYQATQPAVQYPFYRAERQREVGRSQGVPLLMVRLDSSAHNYSSARLDTQSYGRAVAGIQSWLSGTEHAVGTLNRVVDLIAAEARFSLAALRRRPARVRYKWTWPTRPHVDPSKEALAEATGLENRTLTLTDAVAARGRSIETHIETLRRERQLFEDAGLPIPEWLREPGTARTTLQSANDVEEAAQNAAAEAAASAGGSSAGTNQEDSDAA